MRALLAVLLGLLFATALPAQGQPEPDTPEQSADKVLAAYGVKNEKALRALAEKDTPDPWLVADELCFRGQHDAAEAFAKAAPRKDVEKLSTYVESRRGKPDNAEERKALAATNEALAKKEWRKVLDLSVDTPKALDTVVRVRLAYGRGMALRSLKRRTESATTLTQAGEAARILGWLGRASAAFHEAGSSAYHNSNWRGATVALESRLRIDRVLGDKPGIAATLNNIGAVQDSLGNYDEVLKRYAESLKIKRALDDKPGIADTLNNIGVVQDSLGNYDEALKRYAESLKIKRVLGNKPGIAATLNNIGIVQRGLGNYDEAQASYERALRLLAESPHRQVQAHVSWGMASLHLRQGRADQAAGWALKGLAHVAGLSKGLAEGEGAGARELFSGLFDVAYRATLGADDAVRLGLVMEQGRAGSLRESLGSRSALEAAVIPVALRKNLALARHAERRALDAYRKARQAGRRAAIRAARKAWEETQGEVGRVTRRIERAAKHAAAITLSDPDDLATIQSYLGPTDALVYYALTSEEGVALVVRKDKAHMVALPASKDIEAATETLLDGDRHIDPARVPALRKLLMEPLKLGKDVKRVLVSPMGRLGYVPFSLLFPDHEVVYVPSGTTYGLLLAQKGKHGEKILAFGDPDYQTNVDKVALKMRAGNVTGLARLPGTRKEVEAIADVLFLDKAATESGLPVAVKKRERWRAVHFACHGLLDPERPMLSALALTADTENDGFLTALEIFRMKIPADLVVMSACETGKGKVYKTEGIVGLTRAFMFAGTPRVICSLWKVDDQATRALMVKFYELWNPKDGSKGLPTATALKKAQEFVRGREKWKHPYYRAAWQLWGLPD